MRLHVFPQIMNFSIILINFPRNDFAHKFHKLNCNVNFNLVSGEEKKKYFEIQNRQ